MAKEVLDAGDGLTRGVGYSYVLTATGTNNWTYEWKLGNFLDSQAQYLETEDFVAGQYKWRLRLFPKVTHQEVDYIAVNLVSLNPADVTANVGVAAANYRNPRNSRRTGARFTFKPNEEHGFARFQDRCSIMDPNSEFFCLGRCLVVVVIDVVSTETHPEASLPQSPAPPRASRTIPAPPRASRTIQVSLLSDSLFDRRIHTMHPFGLVYLPDGGVLPMPASDYVTSLTTPTTAACRSLGFDAACMRLWICDTGSDGAVRVLRPLSDRQTGVAMTVGDLCTRSDNATTENLTLYLEIFKDGSRLPELRDDSWILFCKYVPLEGEELVYVGSITIRKSCTVRDLERKARRLTHWTRDVVAEVVVQKEDLRPTRVSQSAALENSGLSNGDVSWLCRLPLFSRINMERLHVLCQDLFCQSFGGSALSTEEHTNHQQHGTVRNEQRMRELLSGPSGRYMESTAGQQPNDRRTSQDEEELCVICWDKPRTSGFLHADSEAHLCACMECAEAVMKTESPRCPLCNQQITQMIKKLR